MVRLNLPTNQPMMHLAFGNPESLFFLSSSSSTNKPGLRGWKLLFWLSILKGTETFRKGGSERRMTWSREINFQQSFNGTKRNFLFDKFDKIIINYFRHTQMETGISKMLLLVNPLGCTWEVRVESASPEVCFWLNYNYYLASPMIWNTLM